MKYSLKNIYIRLLRKNTDFWIIQSIETQKELLSQNWDSPKKMIIAPFWKTSCVSHEESEKRQDLSFLYPCSPVEHKNLVRLLKAWESAFYKNHNIKLYLTLAESWFTDNKVRYDDLNIIPLGILTYSDLVRWYQKCEFVIFPSYCESFGLPLIEGIENGCKIIASDLPFTHAIIDPFMVFDPFDTKSIEEAILQTVTKNKGFHSGNNTIKIENKVNQILSMLQNGKI